MYNDLPIVAKRRVQARMGFFIHAMMYAVMNAGIFAIWYATGATYPWFIWPLLGWGIALLAHSITLFLGPGSPYETRAIQRELHRLRTLPH